MLRRCAVVFGLLCLAFSGRPAEAGPELYFGPGTGTKGIYRLDLSSPGVAEQLVPADMVNTSTGIALDYVGRKLYWIADTQFGSVDKIRRSNLDGSDIELVVTPAGQPAGLKVDPYSGKLYWSERFTNSINVVDVNGGTPEQLISSLHEPRGLELDLAHGHMYWVEYGDNRLQRSNLDGSDVTDIITTGMARPFDVTIDPIRQRLYWVELGPSSDNDEGRVWTANLDGSNPFLIADKQYQPTELVIDSAAGKIYWDNGIILESAEWNGQNVTAVTAPPLGYRNLALDVAPALPEPSTPILLGVAAVGLLSYARRQRKYKA